MKINVPTEPEKESNETICLNNLQALRFAVTGKFGSANLHASADYLYRVLFEPQQLESVLAELKIKNSAQFPNKVQRFKTSLVPVSLTEIPSKDQFIKVVVTAFIKGTDFEACLYPGARQLLEDMIQAGPVRIWTAGDMHGVPEAGIPGSKEQLKKLALAGINQVRNKVAKELLQRSGLAAKDQKNYKMLRTEGLQVRAAEDKFALLENMAHEFESLQVHNIVIVEDRLKNLVKAVEIIQNKAPDLNLHPVWLRQGIHEKSSSEGIEPPPEIYQVSSLDELSRHLRIDATQHTGFIVDYDGVLSDDLKRQELQNTAVYRALQEKNWVV